MELAALEFYSLFFLTCLNRTPIENVETILRKLTVFKKSFLKRIIFYAKIDAKIYAAFIQIAKMESLRRRFRNSTPKFYGIFIQIFKSGELKNDVLFLI